MVALKRLERGFGRGFESRHVAEGDDRGSFPRDGVPAHAPVEADEPERSGFVSGSQDPAEPFERVQPPRVDVLARVPSPASGEHDAERRVVGGDRRQIERVAERGVVAPRASNRERAVARAVEVDQPAPGDERRVELLGALEPLLLGDGEEQLERAVLDRRVVHDAQCEGDADPVVGAERRPGGEYPVAVDADVDPPFPWIERRVRIALAHHVEVSLEDDDGSVAASARRRDAHDDVPLRVRVGLEVADGRPCEHELPRRTLLLRGPGKARQLEEALPDGRRHETLQGRAHRRRVNAAPTMSSPSPSARGQVSAT
jgi:hypothetical protein